MSFPSRGTNHRFRSFPRYKPLEVVGRPCGVLLLGGTPGHRLCGANLATVLRTRRRGTPAVEPRAVSSPDPLTRHQAAGGGDKSGRQAGAVARGVIAMGRAPGMALTSPTPRPTKYCSWGYAPRLACVLGSGSRVGAFLLYGIRGGTGPPATPLRGATGSAGRAPSATCGRVG